MAVYILPLHAPKAGKDLDAQRQQWSRQPTHFPSHHRIASHRSPCAIQSLQSSPSIPAHFPLRGSHKSRKTRDAKSPFPHPCLAQNIDPSSMGIHSHSPVGSLFSLAHPVTPPRPAHAAPVFCLSCPVKPPPPSVIRGGVPGGNSTDVTGTALVAANPASSAAWKGKASKQRA